MIQPTSLAARDSMTDTVLAVQRRLVLTYLTERGRLGATDFEIERDTRIPGNSVRPRRGELVDRGIVVDALSRRKTPRGRWAIVWRVATAAT